MKKIFAWQPPRVYGAAQVRGVYVEQDETDGSIVIQANIVQLPPDVAAAMAAAISTATFPFESSSRRPESATPPGACYCDREPADCEEHGHVVRHLDHIAASEAFTDQATDNALVREREANALYAEHERRAGRYSGPNVDDVGGGKYAGG